MLAGRHLCLVIVIQPEAAPHLDMAILSHGETSELG